MSFDMNRRSFLAVGAGAVLGATSLASPAASSPKAMPTGPVYGRTGRSGIPGQGDGRVQLEGGLALTAFNPSRAAIRANTGVFLCPEPDGRWTIRYGEFVGSAIAD